MAGKLPIATTTFWLLFLSQIALATEYLAAYTGPLSLGGGYDPALRQASNYKCFGATPVDHSPTKPKRLSTSVAESRETLEKATSQSFSLRARYGPMTAAGGIDNLNQVRTDSLHLVYVINLFEDFGSTTLTLTGTGLSSDGETQKGVAIGRPSEQTAYFQSNCGSEFVVRVDRVVEIAALIEFTSKSREEHSELESRLEAGFNALSYGAKVDAKTSSEWSKLVSEFNGKVTFSASGGPTLAVLAPVVQNPKDLNQILTALAKYVTESKKGNAIDYSYVTQSTKRFCCDVLTTIPSQTEIVFRGLFSKYLSAEDGIRAADEILGRWKLYSRFFGDPSAVKSNITDQRDKFERQRLALAGAADQCRAAEAKHTQGENASCSDPTDAVVPFRFPSPPHLPMKLVCTHLNAGGSPDTADRTVWLAAKFRDVKKGEIVGVRWFDADPATPGREIPFEVNSNALEIRFATGNASDPAQYAGSHSIDLVDALGGHTVIGLGSIRYKKNGNQHQHEIDDSSEVRANQSDPYCSRWY